MARDKSQPELLADISLKLDTLLALLVAKTPPGEQGVLVEKLVAQGHPVATIARIVGISENAVAIRLTRIRKKAGKAAGKNRKNAKVTISDQPDTQESAAG